MHRRPNAQVIRARALRRFVPESGGLEADDLHFVGHSTGGLAVVEVVAAPAVARFAAASRPEEEL